MFKPFISFFKDLKNWILTKPKYKNFKPKQLVELSQVF